MEYLQQIIDILSRTKRVLITTHVRPDGDALGSTAALAMGLKQKNIDASVLLLSKLPGKYAFIYDDHGIKHIELPSLHLDEYDAFVVVDTGTWSQLPDLKDRVLAYKKPKIVIDHHLTQENWADVKLVETTAAAAAEVVEKLLKAWNVKFDHAIATALYLGITSDTGWFQFSNTTGETLRLAADLMDAGVDTDRLYQLLYQNEKAERLALHARAIRSLELLEQGKLAVMTVRKSDFEETKSGVGDTENIINWPLQIRSVEVSLLFVEPIDTGPTRVSLRSKGSVNVSKFAEQFGGGGHARASGLKLEDPFEQAKQHVISAMLAAIRVR